MPESIKDTQFMGIKIHDSRILDFGRIAGEQFFGISGLAYDANREVLYMLNDRGRLFSFQIALKEKQLHLLKPISSCRLKDSEGKKLLKPKSDSEGIAIVSKGDEKSLWVSFERSPRIMQFSIDGKAVKNPLLNLPSELQNIKSYQGTNGALEALTYHPKFGFLTTPEFPLKGQKSGYQGIYNINGEVCKFAKDDFDNAVTEFEMMPDGNLLALQRNFSFKDFSTVIILKKISLERTITGRCSSKNIAVMKSDDGWNLDNFEGLTHYKDNIYFMISDDNNNLLQNTILTIFEIVDPK
ncbi:MAG: esterase-like activity of phytase family protein [Epsilonproteobacteria bacterium]|nr:esterase-like activity of phytase family protein [Campylobacterota bacterium]